MSITMQCPGCAKAYAINEKLAGHVIACKHCGAAMSVNSPDASLKAAPRVRVECEHCGKGHWVAAENAGRKTLCKKCGALFRIPDGETMSGRSESAAISRGRPRDNAPPAPVDLDVFGLNDEPPSPLSRGVASDGSVEAGDASEDSAPLPSRHAAFQPLSAAKKKKIARRAAKIDRSRPSTAAFGVSFGAVLTFALIGWRIYRILNSFQRAAARANAHQSAPADLDPSYPRPGLVEGDESDAN